MRRLLTLAMLATMLGALMAPTQAAAQGADPCGDAANGEYPAGYEVVWVGNGGPGSQIILGAEGADTLRGKSGHDILCGFGGNDTLVGGPGHDWIDGGEGEGDVLRGNSGNDTLANGETNREGSGNDDVITIEPEPTPCEQAAIDAGYDPDNYILVAGNDANDAFRETRSGVELFCGFRGDDQSTLGVGDVFLGGAGNDNVPNLGAGNFHGGAGNDTVIGSISAGNFHGGAGDDTVTDSMTAGNFHGGAGDDAVGRMTGGSFDGGDGFDEVATYIGGILIETENPTP